MEGEGEVNDVGIGAVGVRGKDASDSSSSSFLHFEVLQLLGQQIHFWGQKRKAVLEEGCETSLTLTQKGTSWGI